MPAWVIGLFGTLVGFVVSEVASRMREGRANRRAARQRRYEQQLASYEAFTQHVRAAVNGTSGPQTSILALQVAFGPHAGKEITELVQAIRDARSATGTTDPEHATRLAAWASVLAAMIRETEAGLDMPSHPDAAELFKRALSEEPAKWSHTADGRTNREID